MDQLKDKFVKELIQRTIKHDTQLIWNSMGIFHNMDQSGLVPPPNEPLYYLLFESEFRSIAYNRSYYSDFKGSTIYLIYSIDQSGKDGSIIEGYSLYAQKRVGAQMICLLSDCPELYQLSNAITEADNENSEQASQFMEWFLGNS